MDYTQTPQGKDPQLWQLAKKRASFRQHLISYLIINAFFWALWLLMGGKAGRNSGLPWPVWPALGWGIGLVFHYFGAYGNDESANIEREYQKLQHKNKQAL